MKNLSLNLDDLTTNALKRLVQQLLSTEDGKEEELLDKALGQKPDKKEDKNDLADLHEEMHGKPNTPEVEQDDDCLDDSCPTPKKKKGKTIA
jgi:hypothetical protein